LSEAQVEIERSLTENLDGIARHSHDGIGE
jgi:hypothetical protein